MRDQYPNLDSIFETAIDIENAAERAKYLDEACGPDADLRSLVEKLLTADENANSFLERPPAGLAPAHGRNEEEESDNERENQRRPDALGNTLDLPRVVLRSPNQEADSHVQRLNSPEIPEIGKDERYQLHGEIARGGMGAIIKGRDTDLGRDLVFKVLLEEHQSRPEVIQRFLEEAQISGQLQHPGIAPIYELGQFADERPYFSMKLVKGETLAKVLADRGEDFLKDRGKLIGIFEQICQTMAYAHSRGVIHRDLKPSNIMIGAFGEVQVMDWGLAKVLQVGGVADEKKDRDNIDGKSIIQTLRSTGEDTPARFGSSGSETQMGSVIGTPAYMPPEQALGEIDRLDERSDVFGLGAILCQILTGKPPYTGEDMTQVYRLAARGNLATCFARLDACTADADLIQIAKSCLELEPNDRPRNAGILSDQISEYLESVETKRHDAELLAAKQETRAVEVRKRARLWMALTGAVATLIVATIAGFWYWQNQEATRVTTATNQINGLLSKAEISASEATAADRDQQEVKWSLAIDAADQALKRATEAKLGNAIIEQATNDLDRYKQQQQQAIREQTLIKKLDEIRLRFPAKFDRAAMQDTADAYQTAFMDAGLDIANLDADVAAVRIGEFDDPKTLTFALNIWAYCLSGPTPQEKFDNALLAEDWNAALMAGKELVQWKPNDLVAWSYLARVFAFLGDRDGYRDHCEQMLTRFANETDPTRVPHMVGICSILPGVIDLERLPLEHLPQHGYSRYPSVPGITTDQMVGWYETLIALRGGKFEDAEAAATAFLNTGPGIFHRQSTLAMRAIARVHNGDKRGAREDLDTAATEYRTRTVNPASSWSRSNWMPIQRQALHGSLWLSEARSELDGQHVSAASEYAHRPQFEMPDDEEPELGNQEMREKLLRMLNVVEPSQQEQFVSKRASSLDHTAMSINPEDSIGFTALKLRHAGENQAMVSLLKRSQSNAPDDFWLNYELALGLPVGDSHVERISFLRSAVSLRPDNFDVQWNLATTLRDAMALEDAVLVLRNMKRQFQDDLQIRRELMLVLAELEEFEAARTEWQQAVALGIDGTQFSSGQPLHMRIAQYAVFLAAIGEQDAYRQECERLLNLDNVSFMTDTVIPSIYIDLTSVLLPGIVNTNLIDEEYLEQYADDPKTYGYMVPGINGTLGLLAYRNGDYDRAVEFATEGHTSGRGGWTLNRFSSVVHALACRATGETKEARELIDKVKSDFAETDKVAPGTVKIRDVARFQILATKILIREFERKVDSDLSKDRP